MKTEFVNCKTAAVELNMSESYLRKLVRERRVPFYRFAHHAVRFNLEELRHHIEKKITEQEELEDRLTTGSPRQRTRRRAEER